MNQAQVVLPIAFPTLLLILAATFLLPLPLTPLWLLRGCPALRPLFLALRHRRALLTLCRPWRWLLPGAYLLTLSRRLLPGAYVLTLSRRPPPGRGGRFLRLRPIVLLHLGFPRLATVMLAAKRVLLLHPGVPIPRILPLVDRQRGGPWNSAAVPPVPSGATLLPVTAPVLAPAWRRIRPPSAKVHRGPPVVADRNSQDEYRHRLPSHNPPGSVVPGARVPVIPLVDPVHAIVEEVVCLHARGVVDRVARHRDQFRVQRQVDPDAHVGKPDADAHLSDGRGHRAQHHPQHNQSTAHFSVLQSGLSRCAVNRGPSRDPCRGVCSRARIRRTSRSTPAARKRCTCGSASTSSWHALGARACRPAPRPPAGAV